ncbi:MAG: hypothetical protein HW377_1821 [Actinobacteria bacterium]|nr:hypothetical protein [Actinomycetota bacterium]
MKKNAKKETRHLVAMAKPEFTACGRPVGKVLLWAKKGEPGEKDSVCGRCKALKAGRARTEKVAAKHKAVRESGEKKAPAEKKPGKRQPALLVLGDRMPKTLQVTFKGIESKATVLPDGRIALGQDAEPEIFNSPSRAGKAITGREVDGWTFWSYLKADGTLEKLDALRKAVA